MDKITDFLQTKQSKKNLAITLAVLKEFKECESMDEWLNIPFPMWIKLEQFQEFLEHLVNNAPLKKDTLADMNNDRSPTNDTQND